MSDIMERLRFESDAMYKAINDEYVPGTFHLANWNDKPHRLVFDAKKLMEEAAEELERNRAAIDELVGALNMIARADENGTCDDGYSAGHVARTALTKHTQRKEQA